MKNKTSHDCPSFIVQNNGDYFDVIKKWEFMTP